MSAHASKESAKPEWLESLSVLKVEPGDMLVFRSKNHVRMEEVQRLREQMEAALPGYKALLLEQMDIGVVRVGESLFTWDDVDRVRGVANDFSWHRLCVDFNSLADRIAALLPPRQP
jgi:hypothetical protein